MEQFKSQPNNQDTELYKKLEELQNAYNKIKETLVECEHHPQLKRLVQYGEFGTYRFILELLDVPNTALIEYLENNSFPKNKLIEIINCADKVQIFFEANKDYQQFDINRKKYDRRILTIKPYFKKEGSRSCFQDFFGFIEWELDNYLEIGDELVNHCLFHKFNFTERIQLILKNLRDSNYLFEQRLTELRNYPEITKIGKILEIEPNK